MNEDMLMRIREIFKESGKNQTEIAKMLNVTSAYIWKIYNNDSVMPRGMFIEAIGREFNINSEWIKTGKGEKTLSRAKEVMNFLNTTIDCDDDDFKKRFVCALARMDKNEWLMLEKIIDDISEDKS